LEAAAALAEQFHTDNDDFHVLNVIVDVDADGDKDQESSANAVTLNMHDGIEETQ
jgi:hypothetical protein